MRPNPRVAERRAAQKQMRNPPFDQRIVTLAPALGRSVNLKRGKLVSKAETVIGAQWTLHFLYNPSTIHLDHNLAMDTLPEDTRSEFDVSDFNGDTLSSVSWSLLFDRTYETWDRSYANKPAGKYGVYADIRALYGLLGMVPQRAISGIDLITNPMVVSPAQVYFGGPGSLSYYGRIESASVDYSHWTTKMVPNRAVVALNMKIFPKVVAPSYSNPTSSKRGGKTATKRRRTVPTTTTGPSGRFDGKQLPV